MKRGRKVKKKRRPEGSGVLSGIKPDREEWSDIRGRIIYGSAAWRMIKLRQLIGDGSQLPDNYFSARKTEWQSIAAKKRYVLLDEIDSLWNTWSAQCERAALNGDADWFEQQAKAIRKGGLPPRAQFNAKVVQLLELAMWGTQAKQDDREQNHDLTLTPAGKFTDAMASDIYHALEKRELPNGLLLVEGWRFENKERVMEAIHDLAKQLQFALKKQH
jgi:hypothetical protein